MFLYVAALHFSIVTMLRSGLSTKTTRKRPGFGLRYLFWSSQTQLEMPRGLLKISARLPVFGAVLVAAP